MAVAQTFVMRAFKTTPTTGFVYWPSLGAPDPLATKAPVPFGELSDIVVAEEVAEGDQVFLMRAFKTTVTTGFIYWISPDVPDPTATLAPVPFGELTDILVVEVFTTPVTLEAAAVNAVAALTFDNADLEGLTLLDSMGLNDAQNVNCLTGQAGLVSQAFRLDGSTSYVRVPHDVTLESHIGPTGKLSYYQALNPDAIGTIQTIASKFDAAAGERAWQFDLLATGAVRLTVYDPSGTDFVSVRSTNTLSAGVFSRVGFTFDVTQPTLLDQIQLYINGVVETGIADAAGGSWTEMAATQADVVLGASDSGAPGQLFAGLMDEAVIAADRLLAGQIASIDADMLAGDRFIGVLPVPSSLWTMDDADYVAPTVLDVTGNNDGTNSGATTGAQGVVGDAFDFGGVGQVDVPDDISLDPESGSFAGAVAFKMNATASATEALMSKRDTAGPALDNFSLYLSGTDAGELTVEVADDGPGSNNALVQASAPPVNDAWYHGGFRVDRSSQLLELFLDGLKLGEVDISGIGSLENATPFRLGREGAAGTRLDGFEDEAAIWKGAIPSERQMRAISNHIVPSIPSPLVFLSFDDAETSGTTLTDRTRRGNDGTLNGSPTTGITGIVNEAYTFDGVNDYVDVANEAEFDFDLADPFSVAFWFRSSSNNEGLVTKHDLNVAGGWHVFLRSTGTLLMSLSNSDITAGRLVETSSAFNDNNWHHAAVTYDGSDAAAGITWYVDGVAVAMNTVVDTAPGSILNNAPMSVGQLRSSGSPANFYAGDMDELLVFSGELSAEAAAWLHTQGLKGRQVLP